MPTYDYWVRHSEDDAFEDSSGAVSITATTSESDATNEWLGFRFRDVRIPPGSTITAALLSLTPVGAAQDEPDHTFYGVDLDNAGAFTTGSNDISGRARTTATVTWSNTNLGVALGNSTRFDAGDFVNVVQEIIDRAGWALGNAIAIVGHGSADGARDLAVHHWDSNPGRAARLRITFTPPAGTTAVSLQVAASADDAFESSTGVVTLTDPLVASDAVDEWMGWRWDNVTVPPGATIVAASLFVVVDGTTNDEPDHAFYAEDADDAAQFTTGSNDISARSRTTATVTWSSADLAANNTKLADGGTGWFQIPDVKTLVQEVVDRGGWASGNALVIVCQGSADSARDLGIFAYDDATTVAARLEILYEDAAAPVTGTGAITLPFLTLAGSGTAGTGSGGGPGGSAPLYLIEVDWDRDGTYTDMTADTGLGSGTQVTVNFPENGASQAVVAFENRDGAFSPRNRSGAYFPYAGEEGIPIRINAIHDGDTEPLFTGYIMDWELTSEGLNTQKVVLRAGDILALKSEDVVTVAHSSSLDVDGAFAAVFAAMGMVSADYDVSVDSPQALPHFFAQKQPASEVLSQLLSAEMGGSLYTTRIGKATFRPRNHFLGVSGATAWGDNTEIKPVAYRESRQRGELVTKVETSLSKFSVGAGGIVVWVGIPSFLDISTGATLSRALAPGEEWGPVQIIPNRNGVQSITGTPVITSGIDYLVNASADGTGLDRTSDVTVRVAPDPISVWACWVTNTHASDTLHAGFLQARAVALTDDGGSENGSRQETSPTGGLDSAAGTVAWTNETNIASSNDSDASVVLTAGQTSQYLTADAWGFDIPTIATIRGVLFEAELADGTQTTQAVSCRLIKGGTVLTVTTKSQVIGTSDAYYGFGGASELWGTSLTPEEVNAATFGCALFVPSALADTYTCDHVKATVFYSVPIGTSNNRTAYTNELEIPDLKVTRSRSFPVAWVDNDNLVRDFGHSELMKGRYPSEEIELKFAWKNDATRTEMIQLEYGQLKQYKDTGLVAHGLFADDYYRVVGYQHNITIGAVEFTTVRLRPANLFHNIDVMTWDQFERSDGAPGKTPTGDTWTVTSGTWAISSGKLVATSSGHLDVSEIEVDPGASDFKLLVQLSELVEDTGHLQTVRYRYVDSSNFWAVQRDTSTGIWKIVKVTAGAGTDVQTFTIPTGGATAELRMIVQGSRHRVYLDRRLIFTFTDSAHSSGTKVVLSEQITQSPDPGTHAEWDNVSVIRLS